MFAKELLLGILLSVLSVNVVLGEDSTLIIDTKKLDLTVKSGQRIVMVLKNISIGRNGAGIKLKRGDDITPLGNYRISWINTKTPYYRFYGFNYPTRHNAKQAFLNGLINGKTYNAIKSAHDQGKIPPQNSVLGGQIGIHGLGKGDERIHRLINWTHGCVALTNEQIDRLQPWIKEGTWVLVK